MEYISKRAGEYKVIKEKRRIAEKRGFRFNVKYITASYTVSSPETSGKALEP